MNRYFEKIAIKFIKHSKEKTYQYILKHSTKCKCFLCRLRMRYIDFRVRIDAFYVWLYHRKWVNVEIRGSDEVISRQRVRLPDGKGFNWPKTDYKNVKAIEVAGAA